MSAVTSGSGFFSGLNTSQIIDQLMQVEQRPLQLIQARIQQMQIQEAGVLGINAKLQAIKTATEAFRTNKTFQTKKTTSSNADVLSATADATAAAGSYTFLVDRLVSTQQMLSRGFGDKDVSGAGITSFTVESTRARLDSDQALADFNGGAGVARGKIVVTDSGGRSATVDLSRATSLSEVLDAINGNGTALVTASARDGRLVIRDNASATTAPTVANATGYTTADSLGLTTTSSTSGGERVGASIFGMSRNTTLASLNDGNGVMIRSAAGTDVYNLVVKVTEGGVTTDVKVNVGDVYATVDGKLQKTAPAVSTVGQALDRINTAVHDAGFGTVSADLDATNGRIQIVDASSSRTIEVTENPTLPGSTTARDLGILSGPVANVLSGRRVFAGLNTVLSTSLNGGSGVTGDGALNFTLRNGSTFTATLDLTKDLGGISRDIEAASGNRVRVALNGKGTGLLVTDLTGGSSSNLIITGTSGSDTAASLGISTGAGGVTSATVTGANLQRQYVSANMRLSDNPLHRAVGTGTFRITDSSGASKVFTTTENMKTIYDAMKLINDGGMRAKARINSRGDGIEIYEDTTGGYSGTQKITVSDVTGVVAKALNIAGQASGLGADNHIDGSFEQQVTVTANDTLQGVADKINAANAGVSASIIRDGTGATPYRLSITSSASGSAGRLLIDSSGVDLGLTTLDNGQDARLFFGSSDAARGVAATRSTNTFDDLIPGVHIDAKTTNASAVTLAVSSDRDAIVSAINLFTDAFNQAVQSIDTMTKYDADTQKGGPLVGDGTMIELRSRLFAIVQGPAKGVASSFQRLADVGVTVGADGQLDVDATKLNAALDQDAAGVEALFTAQVQESDATIDLGNGVTVRNPNAGQSYSSLGIMGLMAQMSKQYIDSTTGVLTFKKKGYDDQISLQNARISDLNTRLNAKRALLERQFLAMEQTIGQLQSQQTALGAIK